MLEESETPIDVDNFLDLQHTRLVSFNVSPSDVFLQFPTNISGFAKRIFTTRYKAGNQQITHVGGKPSSRSVNACCAPSLQQSFRFALRPQLCTHPRSPTPAPASPRANLRAGRRSSDRRWSRAIAALLFCSARWLRGSGCGTGSRPAG